MRFGIADCAWAAGFHDGEGTVGCYDRKYVRKDGSVGKRLIAQVTQVERQPLDRLAAIFGGRVGGPYRTSSGKSLACRWSLENFEAVQQYVAALWPWLTDVKREQAKRALKTFVADQRRFFYIEKVAA